MTTRMLAERVLAALYASEPHAKVVVAATGGGSSAAELLFRAGSSSTMLQFSVPYARASLQNFLLEPRDPAADHVPRAKLTKFCSQETSERMAVAAWQQAQDILRHESEEDNPLHAHALPATLARFRLSVGVACTAALATSYEKQGPHQCFLSICKASVADRQRDDRSAPLLRQQCETYHLNLSKSLNRTRSEEDHIVSHWLVYLLAKSTGADPVATQALHEALLSEQLGDDQLTVFPESDGSSLSTSSSPLIDPLEAICCGASGELTSVAFLPGADSVENLPAVVVKDLGFRGVVLSGSFNPLHQGHVDLARAAQRLVRERGSGAELPIAFEIAVSNADKGAIALSTVMERVRQFTGAGGTVSSSHNSLGVWPVLVTNATLFSQKASLLKGCAFVIGADTAVRIVDKKYYGDDEHRMVLTLQQIARNDCFFIVAGRFDDKVTHRFISADEVLESCIPAVFKELFMPLSESVFRNDLSSTQLRNHQQ